MNMQKTGAFIHAARQRLHLSQKALGEYLMVTDKAVSKWERGLACPDIENLKNMAQLFKCSISDIIDGTIPVASNSSLLDVKTEIVEKDFAYLDADVTADLDYGDSQSISPLLFGDNLEHTRNCIYGGLSAEILRNRKFVSKADNHGCAHEWYAVGKNPALSIQASDDWGRQGYPYTRHAEGYKKPRHDERCAQYITSHKAGAAGIGQKDLFLKADSDYEFTIVAKAFRDTELSVTLLSYDRTVFTRGTITIHEGDYEEQTITLHTTVECPDARLELTFDKPGTVMIGALSMMPAGHFRGMRRDVIETMKELGIKLLRWPGGNFAGDYFWKDGLLPRNMRAPYQSHMWFETQCQSYGYDFNEFNTDDFIALCREIGAEPFITINPVWNSPEENAQWVEYCNGDETTPYGKLRAENGHPQPYNVHFWSLGNELGHGHMEGPRTATAYAKEVRPHAEKMLKVNPSLLLCSCGPYPNEEWALLSGKALSDISTTVSLHHYAFYPLFIDPERQKEDYLNFICKVDTEFLPRMKALHRQLSGTGIKISFDEWNAWYAWHRTGSVAEGMMAAAFLHMLFKNADRYGVMMACHFESINEGAVQVYPDCVKLTPVGQVLSVMKHHANGMICALEEDVVSTRKGSVVSTTLLNRSYDTPKRFTLNGCGDILSAELYSSEDVVQGSVFEADVLPAARENGTVEVVLPPHSMALLRTAAPAKD